MRLRVRRSLPYPDLIASLLEVSEAGRLAAAWRAGSEEMPGKMPDTARALGKSLRNLKSEARAMKDESAP